MGRIIWCSLCAECPFFIRDLFSMSWEWIAYSPREWMGILIIFIITRCSIEYVWNIQVCAVYNLFLSSLCLQFVPSTRPLGISVFRALGLFNCFCFVCVGVPCVSSTCVSLTICWLHDSISCFKCVDRVISVPEPVGVYRGFRTMLVWVWTFWDHLIFYLMIHHGGQLNSVSCKVSDFK